MSSKDLGILNNNRIKKFSIIYMKKKFIFLVLIYIETMNKKGTVYNQVCTFCIRLTCYIISIIFLPWCSLSLWLGRHKSLLGSFSVRVNNMNGKAKFLSGGVRNLYVTLWFYLGRKMLIVLKTSRTTWEIPVVSNDFNDDLRKLKERHTMKSMTGRMWIACFVVFLF